MPGRADAALGQLAAFIYSDAKLGPNTLYSEGSQCNESPLMAAFSLQQMLLQSFDGDLHVFPALPRAWPNATFFQMRTEGAFLVSASARGGATRAVHIQSLAGSPCVLRAFGDGVEVESDPPNAVVSLGSGRLNVTIGMGGDVLVWERGAGRPDPSTEFAPLPVSDANRSHWGFPGHGRVPPPPPPSPPPPSPPPPPPSPPRSLISPPPRSHLEPTRETLPYIAYTYVPSVVCRQRSRQCADSKFMEAQGEAGNGQVLL